jgi:cytoskeletal protein CcmA (bactofilin family)
MFNPKTNMNKSGETEANARNHFAAGTKMNGDIETNGDIRIDGVLIGSVTSKGKVVIGDSGRVDGSIFCQNAAISGELKGKIKVGELLSIQSSAKIQGEIETLRLSIEPGAQFNGNCNMGAVIKDIKGQEELKIKEKTA